jgi:ABC-type lipoprotein release transport system permease subunit
MTLLRLALRNLLGAGLRTWLNVIVLSLSFVAIIYVQGMLEGVNRQAADAMIQSEYAGGQYWHQNYDPYDPLALPDAHGPLPPVLAELVQQGKAAPILVAQGTIYPEGRARAVLLKGIDPTQSVIALPTQFLAGGDLPALIGQRMAKSTGLRPGDLVTIQWRDVHGTFDAREARIAQVMTTTVPTIDNGQIWLPRDRLAEMTGVPGQATLVVIGRQVRSPSRVAGWTFRDLSFLLHDIRVLIRSKSAGSSVLYLLLLFLAMLAIFDTQVLSLFRRRREMGTLMALGMTRGQLIRLFTLEGALHGVLAGLAAALYGLPLFAVSAHSGWTLPSATGSMGFAISERVFPAYSAGLVLGTTLLVLIVTTIVSFLPTRRIARLKPFDALRGRFS